MTWVSIIAMIFTGVGLIISVIALIQSRKANKAALKQNLEQERAAIIRELADIDVEIEREKSAGNEINSHIYGVQPNPHICEIVALEKKRDILLKRKQEIERKL